ncbi:MAG: RecQ family ATP-dependent DNA helicase [Lachnospiraceae bacterium]|nr:RecQ family ATP-dependent DNA helicase [Ruminococcus sp.]MCM1275615.1 RecQ family ATP-dependent DNA helicase [Lachnospiraceae bacterium]
MEKRIVYVDTEVNDNGEISDIGAVWENGDRFHEASVKKLADYISGADFICGHNIIEHDKKYIEKALGAPINIKAIDTLYLSPLMFPEKHYHRLLKDDKLLSDALNDPVNDAKKARDLFHEEESRFFELEEDLRKIYCALLHTESEFGAFFEYVGFSSDTNDVTSLIRSAYRDKICENADLGALIADHRVELAYALALISVPDCHSVTPPWLTHKFPKIEKVMRLLCGTRCEEGCRYCSSKLDPLTRLKEIYGFDGFRSFDGEPLQERAVEAAVNGRSLLTVFPTSGGKSLTFQLPALIAGQTVRGLTVVISPLQSLMKDQVDNLVNRGISAAVAINGLLSPVERTSVIERVENGTASILYISPEQLRSRAVTRLLLGRNIVRFVIDEAHCFSAWGQDFRVDYLYIGKFIREYCAEKGKKKNEIPVSCFTATAKTQVKDDICGYFEKELGLELERVESSAARKNLSYTVISIGDDGDGKDTDKIDRKKYNALLRLIEAHGERCPTIVYVARTRRTKEVAEKLTKDDHPALPFNGKMNPADKTAYQNAFMSGDVNIIVATSAFGMGVDKPDVGLVVHYDISSSLEDYLQEAGRAGRDPSISADCYILFNNSDLDKNFILLNQTKVGIKDIQAVRKAVKQLMGHRGSVCCSALEIARKAGWDNSQQDAETRVKTALSALEQAKLIERGKNRPRVFATSILVKNVEEARKKIETSGRFSNAAPGDSGSAEEPRLSEVDNAVRIIKCLISERSKLRGKSDDAESRVEYLADTLSLNNELVISLINRMREVGVLEDENDMSAFISAKKNKALNNLEEYIKLDRFLLDSLSETEEEYSLKELNMAAQDNAVPSTNVKRISAILFFFEIKNYIKRERRGSNYVKITPKRGLDLLRLRAEKRYEIARFVIEELTSQTEDFNGVKPVEFSLVGIYKAYLEEPRLESELKEITLGDVEDALLYLTHIGSLKIEGGFLVVYNSMQISCSEENKGKPYTNDDYRQLKEFYRQRVHQIHIVGEYAKLMAAAENAADEKDAAKKAALDFVSDYFEMDFLNFRKKYFKNERSKEIELNITPEKYHQLMNGLSDEQKRIFDYNNDRNPYMVVPAGPGSGKTRVLVHKLASLMMLEDEKHEQLLMLTFSRAAAIEFKTRLRELIGSAANFVEIKTFHSYCFDLCGQVGRVVDDEEEMKKVITDATEMIKNGEIEESRIAKSVLVIDEAQDMDAIEYELIKTLIERNKNMRVIAVGDDDQSIYAFRGASPEYMQRLIDDYGAQPYELLDNYRSGTAITALANRFVKKISDRLKTDPIRAMSAERGIVRITRYKSAELIAPVTQNVVETYHGGRAAVLTCENEEAMLVCSALKRQGVNARLIQDTGRFKLRDLAEVDYFLSRLTEELHGSVISRGLWESSKADLNERFSGSACLEVINNMLNIYRDTCGDSIYMSDFEMFIKEARYEDFFPSEPETVYVSTIHKAKGREFDSVYLMIANGKDVRENDRLRCFYVGLTRAKRELYIHYSGDLFDSCRNVTDAEFTEDSRVYPDSAELILTLSLENVYISYLKNNDPENNVRLPLSGEELRVDGDFLANGNGERVTRFSSRFSDYLNRFLSKDDGSGRDGYSIESARAAFVIMYPDEDDPAGTERFPVILPELCLRKNRT